MPPRVTQPAILPCPGLRVTRSGSFFTDHHSKVHDLELESTLRPKEAAADPRLCGISVIGVRSLIRDRELYPVLRRNARVILIFDCALTDWRARAVQATGKHLFITRATKAA